MHQKTLSLRVIGLIASLIFTLAAYFIIIHPDFFHLGNRIAIAIIIGLASFQFIAQSIFFLDLGREKGPPWVLVFFVSTLPIILIIIGFSIWIIDRLNHYMMP